MLVQKLRIQRGWSQSQLAELSGLSARTIQRIENGKSASPESLKSLAAVFEIEFSTLLKGNDMNQTAEVAGVAVSAEEAAAMKQVRKLRGFYIHLTQYVIVCSFLALVNLITHPQKLWFQWPMLGWGIGVLAHGLSISSGHRFSFFGAEWERKQIELRLGRKL